MLNLGVLLLMPLTLALAWKENEVSCHETATPYVLTLTKRNLKRCPINDEDARIINLIREHSKRAESCSNFQMNSNSGQRKSVCHWSVPDNFEIPEPLCAIDSEDEDVLRFILYYMGSYETINQFPLLERNSQNVYFRTLCPTTKKPGILTIIKNYELLLQIGFFRDVLNFHNCPNYSLIMREIGNKYYPSLRRQVWPITYKYDENYMKPYIRPAEDEYNKLRFKQSEDYDDENDYQRRPASGVQQGNNGRANYDDYDDDSNKAEDESDTGSRRSFEFFAKGIHRVGIPMAQTGLSVASGMLGAIFDDPPNQVNYFISPQIHEGSKESQVQQGTSSLNDQDRQMMHDLYEKFDRVNAKVELATQEAEKYRKMYDLYMISLEKLCNTGQCTYYSMDSTIKADPEMVRLQMLLDQYRKQAGLVLVEAMRENENIEQILRVHNIHYAVDQNYLIRHKMSTSNLQNIYDSLQRQQINPGLYSSTLYTQF